MGGSETQHSQWCPVRGLTWVPQWDPNMDRGVLFQSQQPELGLHTLHPLPDGTAACVRVSEFVWAETKALNRLWCIHSM